MKLLEICLETYFKTIDGRILKQIDGTPIGKSISGPIADIFMIWFEEEYVFNDSNEFQPYLKAWKDSEMTYIYFGMVAQRNLIASSGS